MEWDVVITVQTALHVGDGERWYRDADFVLEQTPPRARLIDVDRALDLVDDAELQRIRDGKVAAGLGRQRREECTIAVLPVRRLTNHSQVSEWVLRFVRDGNGRLYLPGSTVKGALRTAVLRTLLRRERVSPQGLVEERQATNLESRLRTLRFDERQATPENRDALRALRVTDFYPLDDVTPEFREVEVRSIRDGRRVLSVWAETVPRGTGFRGRIAVDEATLRGGKAEEALKELLRGLPQVLKDDTLATLRTLNGWEGSPSRTGPYGAWLEAAAGTTPPFAFLGWGTGWIPHTVGAVLGDARSRLDFARVHRLGRRPGSGADFPKTGKFALVRFDGGTAPMPLGLVSIEFTTLPGTAPG